MSRTLGFIAGLTLPAGIYYISTLHIRGTADFISTSLHDKSLRLAGQSPTNADDLDGQESLPATHARSQEGLSAAIQRRWNGVIESAHTGLTETDWSSYANRAWRQAASLAPSGETVERKIVDLRQAGIDAEVDARHRLTEASHEASVKAHELAHTIRDGAHAGEVRAKQLGDKIASDTVEARRRAGKVGERIAQEATEIRRRASGAVHDAKDRLTPDRTRPVADTLAEAYENAAREASEAATEAKVMAVDRWRAMLDAAEESAADRHKRLLAELGPRRVGFVR